MAFSWSGGVACFVFSPLTCRRTFSLLFPSFFIPASLVLSNVNQILVILGNSEFIFRPGVFYGYVRTRSFVLLPQCCKMVPVFSSKNQMTTNTNSDTPTNLYKCIFPFLLFIFFNFPLFQTVLPPHWKDNWLSGQIVSDGRIQITLLILSRDALSYIFLIPSDAKLASKPSVARAP